MSDNENVIVKYSSYTDAQKRATQKYRANNKDKVNEQRKKYYQQRKESDPNFLEYKRAKAREYYQKKKHQAQDMINQINEALDQNTPEATNEPDLESEFKEFDEKDFQDFQESLLNPPLPEQTPEPDIDEPIETVEVKPKKKRAPRKKKVTNV